MNLADVVDLEAQFLKDSAKKADGQGQSALTRDRRIGEEILRDLNLTPEQAREQIDHSQVFRRDLALRWIGAMRERQGLMPGQRLERGYRFVGWVLAIFGGFLGVGTATATLAYDGTTPINVFFYLSIFVLLQIVLLLLMLFVTVFRKVSGTGGLLGWTQNAIAWLSGRKWVDRFVGDSAVESGRVLGALRSRRVIYGDIEKWTLFSLTQRFGLAFNLCALIAAFLLVTFSDLAFCWSTTLDTDASSLKRLFGYIAAPWSWLAPGGIPTEETIAKSQWVRLHGEGFVGGRNLEEAVSWARDWWPFLLLALLFWGVIPRLCAWLFGQWRARKAFAALPFDHASCQQLFERLLPPTSSWESPAPEAVYAPPLEADEQQQAHPQKPAPIVPKGDSASKSRKRTPTHAAIILWGRLSQHPDAFGGIAEVICSGKTPIYHGAGGADLTEEQSSLNALNKASLASAALFVEAGVQPTKEIFGFLREVRDRVGARTPISVLILSDQEGGWRRGDADECRQWQARLEAEGDPYLALHAMVDLP